MVVLRILVILNSELDRNKRPSKCIMTPPSKRSVISADDLWNEVFMDRVIENIFEHRSLELVRVVFNTVLVCLVDLCTVS